jgi:multidrug efflux pump subunit AcrA (membrane-fusion protein)
MWIIIAAILAGGIAYYALRNRSAAQEPAKGPVATVRTARVTTGALERTTRLAGQTSARNYATIVAPILRGPEMRGNLIILKMVPSGSMVKKGDVLVEIDGQAMKDHLDDINDTVEAAEADVRKRRAEQQIEWDNLQQNLRVAKAEWEKAKLDYQPAEIRTDIERQLLKLSLDEAEAKYRQAEKDVAFKQAAHKAELRILEITRERHIRHRDRHVVDVERCTIKAPMGGLAVMSTVFRGGDITQIQQGDQVFSGQQIMKIVDPDSMQVEASVNQAESSDFRIGQPARVTFDGFGGISVMGHIYSIGALATRGWRENFYIRNIPVRIKLDTQDHRVIPDLSASVNVILGKVDNAAMVPLGAVSTERGKTYAWVKTGEGFDRREVELGLHNDTHAAVLSGLSAGDEVRLN